MLEFDSVMYVVKWFMISLKAGFPCFPTVNMQEE